MEPGIKPLNQPASQRGHSQALGALIEALQTLNTMKIISLFRLSIYFHLYPTSDSHRCPTPPNTHLSHGKPPQEPLITKCAASPNAPYKHRVTDGKVILQKNNFRIM